MQMRKRNDELLRANKDATDSPGQQKFFSPNEQVLQLQDELKKREATHTERIVEMVKIKSIVHFHSKYSKPVSIGNA